MLIIYIKSFNKPTTAAQGKCLKIHPAGRINVFIYTFNCIILEFLKIKEV